MLAVIVFKYLRCRLSQTLNNGLGITLIQHQNHIKDEGVLGKLINTGEKTDQQKLIYETSNPVRIAQVIKNKIFAGDVILRVSFNREGEVHHIDSYKFEHGPHQLGSGIF